MFQRVRDTLWNTALGPAIVIWGFGYILVDIVGVLIGNNAPGENLLASIPLLVLGVSLTIALDRLWGALQKRNIAFRSLIFVGSLALATVLHSLFDLYWIRWVALAIFPDWQSWAVIISLQRFSTAVVVYLWTFCLAFAVLWAARARGAAEASAARAAMAETATAKAEASLHRAQAAALRLQLNPHFLFNTLNSISSLVVLGRNREAEDMIESLSDFLRASLNSDPTAEVPLTHEIDSVDAYLNIEAARFGERLEIDIDVDPAATDARVPNFILQPLVENAIKHGVAAVRGPASVRVAAAREGEELVLSVSNTAPFAEDPASPAEARERPGIGLANIRQRLVNSYAGRATLETSSTRDGYHALIRLPFEAA